MQSLIQRLHRFEDLLLAGLLCSLIVLATAQILLRNLFDSGFVWIDPLLRVLVLWLGLIGAAVATRSDRHIRIDLLSRYFNRGAARAIEVLVCQLSAWTCLIIAYHGFNWVRLDFIDRLVSFSAIPAWVLEAVIPVTFAIIGLRYLALSWYQSRLLLRRCRAAARMSK